MSLLHTLINSRNTNVTDNIFQRKQQLGGVKKNESFENFRKFLQKYL